MQHGVFVLGPHPSTNPAKQGLTLLSGQDAVLSLWYSDSMLTTLLLISKMRKGNKKSEKSLILPGKINNQKHERNENENYYLLWWLDKKRYFLYNYCLGLLDEDNSLSQTDNFMNVFNSVTSPQVFSYCFALFLNNATALTRLPHGGISWFFNTFLSWNVSTKDIESLLTMKVCQTF